MMLMRSRCIENLGGDHWGEGSGRLDRRFTTLHGASRRFTTLHDAPRTSNQRRRNDRCTDFCPYVLLYIMSLSQRMSDIGHVPFGFLYSSMQIFKNLSSSFYCNFRVLHGYVVLFIWLF